MEIWEYEARIEYLECLNRESCERPEVIRQREIYIDYLKTLMNNKKKDE